jgi:hypothetical protein
MVLTNVNGTEFEMTEEKYLEVSAATILLEESFDQFDGTPDEFLERAHLLVPTPTYLNRTVETTFLGNAIFVGIGMYGQDFIKKMLSTEIPEDLIFSLFNYTLSIMDILNVEESQHDINA